MPLQLPGLPEIFKKRSSIFRTELFKFAELNIKNTTGAPVGQWEEGTMFANLFDKFLYVSTNYKRTDTPSVLWLKFNGNVQDYSSKSGKTQCTTSGSPNYNTGKYGNGIEIDGSDDKLTLTGMGVYLADSPTSELSFSFWIKPEVSVTSGQKIYIFECYKDANNFFLIYFEKTANLTDPTMVVWWNKEGNSGGGTFGAGERIAEGVWNHVHIRAHPNGNVKMQINKQSTESQTSGEAGDLPIFTTEDATIGYSEKDTSFGDYQYTLDSLKIWNSSRETGKVELDYENLDLNHWMVSPTAMTFTPAI